MIENNEMGKNVPPWDLWLGLREQERMGQFYIMYTLQCIVWNFTVTVI